MQDPRQLYDLTDAAADYPGDGRGPVLLHALTGFIDAGSAGRLAADHLRENLPSRVVATFDVDLVLDYRARRPAMTFSEDHWSAYERPVLQIEELVDADGQRFLLLTGPEPDVQWERFTAAVVDVVRRLGVRLTLGIHAIPMAVPHTRPSGLTAHATRPEILGEHRSWVGTVQVPGNVAALLELRLGEAGRDAGGYAVHVPHYLAQSEYPQAAVHLLEAVSALAGLRLPVAGLHEAAARTRAAVDEQIADNAEVQEVVRALEDQYDAFVGGERRSLLADPPSPTAPLPTAEELGAELERFLAEENERRRRSDG